MSLQSERSTGMASKHSALSVGGARSSPRTRQPCASRCCATARPMPLLLPVTTAVPAAPVGSFDTDVALGDDLLRARHVLALELGEVLRAARREHQPLRDELVAQVG